MCHIANKDKGIGIKEYNRGVDNDNEWNGNDPEDLGSRELPGG